MQVGARDNREEVAEAKDLDSLVEDEAHEGACLHWRN